jgi:cell division protein ZapA
MANRITVSICGEDYTLVAEESTAYMEQVAALVDKKMKEVIAGVKVGRNDAAVLAAVNLADELLKNEQSAENLRRQVKSYLDEAAQAKSEVSDLKRQLFRAQQGKK